MAAEFHSDVGPSSLERVLACTASVKVTADMKSETSEFAEEGTAAHAEAEWKLRKALKTDLSGTSVVMISQRTTSLKDADKIIVMEDGAPVGIGTHDELLESCEVYRDIYRSQMNEKEDSHA